MEVETEIVYEKSDGEISTDSETPYIPLERPQFIHNEKVIASKVTGYLSDDNLSNISESSLSDSDSDHNQSKKPKTKLKLNRRNTSTQRKPNKYTIWNSHANEDFLTETMISCDVTQTDRSRDVESYNYPKKNLKRSYDNRSNVHLRLGAREDCNNEELRGGPRHLLDLAVTLDNTEEEIAVDISNKLFEEKDDLLKRLVEHAGKAKAIELFIETKRIEADGGMLIMNQTRRRTPGGVYFFLVKQDDKITEEQKKLIFRVERQMANRAKRKIQKKKKNTTTKKVADNLPNLLSRAEIEIAKGNRERKESDHTENVSNPPPSPVTDGKENSSDEMTDNTELTSNTTMQQNTLENTSTRSIQSYDDDFLEIECGNEMDFFS